MAIYCIYLIKRNIPHNNSPQKYLKDSYLKNAFAGKKIKANLFVENNSFQNGNKNFIPLLRKNDTLNDSRIKDNKFKSLINYPFPVKTKEDLPENWKELLNLNNIYLAFSLIKTKEENIENGEVGIIKLHKGY